MWPSHKEEGRWGQHLSGQNVAKPDENDLLAAPNNKQTERRQVFLPEIFLKESLLFTPVTST